MADDIKSTHSATPSGEKAIPTVDVGNELAPLGHDLDLAAKFWTSLDPEIRNKSITPEESRRVLWKIDLIILPLLGISVMISAIDKVIISNAAVYGMREDAHLVGDQFSWVGSIFYFGFLIAEWPGNLLIQRLPLRTFFTVTILCWAILTFVTGATRNFSGLASVRFLSTCKLTKAGVFSSQGSIVLITRKNSGHI